MKLLTAKEAGELIGVTHHAIYKYKDAGKLSFITIGDGPKAPIRFKKKDILKLLVQRDKIYFVTKNPIVDMNKVKADIKQNTISHNNVIYNNILNKLNNI